MANILKKLDEYWRLKTPKQKWDTIYYIGGVLGEPVGVTVFTTMKVTWYSYMSEGLSFIYLLSAIYTIWYYFGQQEYCRGLESTNAFGVLFAVNIFV